MKIRYEQITQALWHRYTDPATRKPIPAIGVMQFYRFYRRVRLDRMTIVPQVVRWASTPTETRALDAGRQLDGGEPLRDELPREVDVRAVRERRRHLREAELRDRG